MNCERSCSEEPGSPAMQSEDHRYGGRGGQSQRVVEVQQQHVAQHHAQEEHHDLLKGELPGVEDAAAGDLHHAARGERADENAGSCDPEDYAARRDLRTQGRVEEIDGVVGDAHDDAHHGQQGQDDDDCGEKWRHSVSGFVIVNGILPLQRSETDVTKVLRGCCGGVKITEWRQKKVRNPPHGDKPPPRRGFGGGSNL